MTSIGVEINPRFHQFSTKAAAAVGWDRIDFKLQSILDTDVTPADIIYSTMTCLNAKTRHSLRRVCETCRPGTLVVTTSQSLESPLFKVLDVKPVWFSWGRGQVYIHQRQ